MNVIPAIDLRGGRCVRLYQGEFDRETVYSDTPAEIAGQYADSGATWLHLVDLDGARAGTAGNAALVQRIATETPMKVQVGGGIRDAETVARWLDSGVDRVVVGSVAITDPAEVREWFDRFGSDAIVLALDVRLDDEGNPYVTTHGWQTTTAQTLWAAVDMFLEAGLRHVLCTDVGRDGAMSGPNVDLYKSFVARYPAVELQASGGVRGLDDLLTLRASGSAAAITGRALLDGSLTLEEVRRFLRDG